MGVTQRTASLGVGQSWQNVTASRAGSTTYTNATGKPIQVAVNFGSSLQFQVNGQVMPTVTSNATVHIVPPGATYFASGVSLVSWWELR